MKLISEEQLLDPDVRKLIIDEINLDNNLRRKNEALKRHEIFKDNTLKYVLKKLENEGLKKDTLILMSNRASNISICKKIVQKLARAYQEGVSRETGDDNLNQQISLLSLLLDFDNQMKKVDRYLRLQRNCLPWVMPEKCSGVNEPDSWILKMKVLGPWQYDAVDNVRDPDRPIAIILSDFHGTNSINKFASGRNQVNYTDSEGTEWRNEQDMGVAEGGNVTHTGPVQSYIFWGNKYHFTCDKNGQIISQLSPQDLLNPIGEIPGDPLAKDRDDGFWASGGEDLADGAILVNTLLTDMFAILFMQGWGQTVITAPKGSIPKEIEAGPHHAMVFEYDSKKGQERPQVQVVSSNPPVAHWMSAIEQYVALLLSTNNLSPSTVAAKLDVHNAASGIAMLIEKSESTEDITDSQGYLAKSERRLWSKIVKWYNIYQRTKTLDNEFAAAGTLPDRLDVSAKFRPPTMVVTEGERLDNMAKKKSLAIVEMVDLIKEENPNMTDQEAEQKLLKIKKDRLENAVLIATNIANGDQQIKPPADPMKSIQ